MADPQPCRADIRHVEAIHAPEHAFTELRVGVRSGERPAPGASRRPLIGRRGVIAAIGLRSDQQGAENPVLLQDRNAPRRKRKPITPVDAGAIKLDLDR